MKKIFLIPLFLILCASFFSLSAQNWQPGFVIVNETDTLFGEIDFRMPRVNQKQAVFRKNANSPVQTFLPGEIFGYRFYEKGKFYVSREIMIGGEPRIVFLEFLVKGMMNLFYYVDATNQFHEVEYFFFEDQTGRMIPISRRPGEPVSSTTRHQDLRFRPALRLLFQEHESIVNQVNRLDFNHQSMIEIVRMYHNLTCPIGEECIVFANPHPNREFNRVNFSVYGGMSLLIERYFSNYSVFSTSPMIGGRINIYAPRIDRNLSVQIDLGFFQFDSNSYLFPLQIGAKYAFLGRYRLRPTVGVGSSGMAGFERTERGTEFRILESFFFYASAGVEFQLNQRNILFFDAELHRAAFSFANFSDRDGFFLMLKAGIRF